MCCWHENNQSCREQAAVGDEKFESLAILMVEAVTVGVGEDVEGAEDISLGPLEAGGPEVGAGLGLGQAVRAWTADTSSANCF